jgi:hypothetical protein
VGHVILFFVRGHYDSLFRGSDDVIFAFGSTNVAVCLSSGEVTSRIVAGNDSGDPLFDVLSNSTPFYPPINFGQNATGLHISNNQSSSSIPVNEDQQLQSLIEALNSLNSSTLQVYYMASSAIHRHSKLIIAL